MDLPDTINLNSMELHRFLTYWGSNLKRLGSKISGVMKPKELSVIIYTSGGSYHYQFKDELNFNKAWTIICSQEHRVSDADYEMYVTYTTDY